MSVKAACITFPGSNCDQDIHRAARLMNWDLVSLWHNDLLSESVDVVLIPGGFSYGDYLRCGALARFSRAMDSVCEQHRHGGLVVGICNGFQILCESGLLPGALHRNRGLQFRCIWTHLKPVNHDTTWTHAIPEERALRIPIAHGEGNYHIDKDGMDALYESGQVVFEYCDELGNATPEANPNGSVGNIAGIQNRPGNILGMMPHPERAMEGILGGTDGRYLFQSIEGALSRAGA